MYITCSSFGPFFCHLRLPYSHNFWHFFFPVFIAFVILIFRLNPGNMINTYDMRSMFNPQRFLFSHGNLPVVGMWIYTLATTLLVTADGLEYFEVTSNFWIPFGQITGSALLGVGSLIYCYWSRPAWIIKPQSSDGVYDN